MASASTSDHHPMPMQATRSGPALTRSSSGSDSASANVATSSSRRSTRRPPCAMRSSVSQSPPLTPMPPMHWPSTRTGKPPSIAVQRSGPAASASPMRMADVEVLPAAPLRRGRALVGGGAHRLGGGGVHGVEAAAVHALEQDQVPAGIGDRAGDRDPGLARHVDGRRHHLLRALMRQALALGDIHCREIRLRGTGRIVRQPVGAIKDQGARGEAAILLAFSSFASPTASRPWARRSSGSLCPRTAWSGCPVSPAPHAVAGLELEHGAVGQHRADLVGRARWIPITCMSAMAGKLAEAPSTKAAKRTHLQVRGSPHVPISPP